jgi:hypothetical protein
VKVKLDCGDVMVCDVVEDHRDSRIENWFPLARSAPSILSEIIEGTHETGLSHCQY